MRLREKTDLATVIEGHQRRLKFIKAECERLAKEIGAPVGSLEVQRLISGSDELRGPLFDYMMLWDTPCGAPNCWGSGAWLPCFWHYPDLSWVGYNNRASHVLSIGINALFDGTWWRGRAVWMYGVTHFDLGFVGFDNMASSSFRLL